MASIGSSIVSSTDAGTHLLYKFDGVSVPTVDTLIVNETVGVGKVWRLRLLEGGCRAFGYFTVKVNSVVVAKSVTGPASENVSFSWSPFYLAAASETVEVWYNQSYGPILDVSCFLFVTELNT